MSFEAFERKIIAPSLKQIARHWNEARGSRVLPGWNHIRPSAIAAQLPIIWSYKYDRRNDSLTGRLAGDVIEAVFGKSFRGTAMNDLFTPDGFSFFFARHKRVVVEPCFFHGVGGVFYRLSRVGTGERIILPLSDNGADGDGILGATLYNPSAAQSAGKADRCEVEEWFALG